MCLIWNGIKIKIIRTIIIIKKNIKLKRINLRHD